MSIRTFLLLSNNFSVNTFSRITFSRIVFLPCAVFEVQFSGPSLLFLSEGGDAGTDHAHLECQMNTGSLLTQELFLPLYLFHFCTKEESQSTDYAFGSYSGCSSSQRWDQLWLWNISELHPPHPKLGAAWMQPARICIFIRFFPVHSSLFFWLSLTQLQLLQFNLFLHKGPGVDTLISRGCFQRCLVAFSPGSI